MTSLNFVSKPLPHAFEQLLIDLDSEGWSSISRVALGLAILPAFRALSGGSNRPLAFAAVFLGVLVALRLVPAVLRRILPFSAEAKAIWAERRNVARQYDSYQWQKLFWIGLGLLPYAFIGRGLDEAELIATLICLLGGGTGLFLWRKHKATLRPQ